MNLSKPRTYVKGYTNYYICIKFGSSSIKNGLGNVKKFQITNLAIMHIFNEVQSQKLLSDTPSPLRLFPYHKLNKTGKNLGQD